MARGFNSTLGAGSTDAIETGFASALSAKHSVFFWVKNRAFTGSLARAWAIGTGGSHYYGVQSGNTQFQAPFTTTNGIWNVNANFSNGAWHAVAITYDGTSTSNTPKIYYDGVSQSISAAQSPSGSFSATAANLYIGNTSNGNRVLDGAIAEFALWSGVVLTASEIAALSKGVPPWLVKPASLTLYLPLYGMQANEPDWGPLRVAQTITGTAKQTHAPVSYWMPPAPAYLPQNFRGSLNLTQGAAATAITAAQKFHATAAIAQQNATLTIAGREKFSSSLALTAPADTAQIYSVLQQAGHPGRAVTNDAAIGGLLAMNDKAAYGLTPADAALYDVTIMESLS